MSTKSFSAFLKNSTFSKVAENKGLSLSDGAADDLYNRLLAHVRGFALTPQRASIKGINVSLTVCGLNPRFWSVDRVEDELSSWRPTITVAVEGDPLRRFKFVNRFAAEKAYALLCSALQGRSITSMGDLHRLVTGSTAYAYGATSERVLGVSETTTRDVEEVNAAATRVLKAAAKRVLTLERAMEIAGELGESRLSFVLERTKKAYARGAFDRAARCSARVEALTGFPYRQWLALAYSD